MILKTNHLLKYHQYLSSILSDMDDIEKTINFNYSEDLHMSEEFFNSSIETLALLNDLIYKKFLDRVKHNSSFNKNFDTEDKSDEDIKPE